MKKLIIRLKKSIGYTFTVFILVFYNHSVTNINAEDQIPKVLKNNVILESSINSLDKNPIDRSNTPLHKVEPGTPVHQWIAYQAYRFFVDQIEGSEIESYIGYDDQFPDFSNTWENPITDNIIQGARDEDIIGANPFKEIPPPYMRHFVAGADEEEIYDGLSGCDSAYERALLYWNDYVIGNYIDDKHLSYYYLGHVAHLLMDMTVPAHVHNNEHLKDSYEKRMGELFPEWYFGVENQDDNYGATLPKDVWNVMLTNHESLESLFRITANYTEDYDSDDEVGEGYGEGNTAFHPSDYPSEWHKPEAANLTDEINDTKLNIIARDLMPYAIKRVAELYRLFYHEVDLIGPVVNMIYPSSKDPNNPTIQELGTNISEITPSINLVAEASDPESGIVKKGYRFQWSYLDPITKRLAEWKDLSNDPSEKTNSFIPYDCKELYAFRVIAENGGGLTKESDPVYLRLTNNSNQDTTPIPSSPISGTLASDTTWSGTVYLTGDVLVPYGKTLTIAAGTKVVIPCATEVGQDSTKPVAVKDFANLGKDADRVEIIVDGGTLIAQGNSSNPIVFTSNNEKASDWYGIRLSASQNSVFDHCTIQYANYGVSVEKGFTKGIRNCLAERNSNGFIAYAACDFIHCTAKQNAGEGFWLETTAALEDCESLENNNNGVSSPKGALVTMKNCQIQGNKNHGFNGGDIVATNGCQFSFNKGHGVYSDKTGNYSAGHKVILENCTVSRNSGSGIYARTYQLLLTGNQIDSNLSYGLYLYSASGGNPVPSFTIRQNTVENNSNNGGVITMYQKWNDSYNSYDSFGYNAEITVDQNNRFSNNSGGGLYINAGKRTKYVSIKNNVFTNNKFGLDITTYLESRNAFITHNTFENNFDFGLQANLWFASTVIESNSFTNNYEEGIVLIDTGSARVFDNTIDNNITCGIDIRGAKSDNLNVAYNKITGKSDNGIKVTSVASGVWDVRGIELNEIQNTGMYAIYNDTPADIYALRNKWKEGFDKNYDIFDNADDNTKGAVIVDNPITGNLPKVTKIEISVPASSPANTAVSCTAKAFFDSGNPIDITKMVSWNVSRSYHSIDANGILTLSTIAKTELVGVSASYMGITVTKNIQVSPEYFKITGSILRRKSQANLTLNFNSAITSVGIDITGVPKGWKFESVSGGAVETAPRSNGSVQIVWLAVPASPASLQVVFAHDTALLGTEKITGDVVYYKQNAKENRVSFTIDQNTYHSGDTNNDFNLSNSEVMRVLQLLRAGGYQCADEGEVTEDGYKPGAGTNHSFPPHHSDFNKQDWSISMTELLRFIQFFGSGGYHRDASTEDGFAPGKTDSTGAKAAKRNALQSEILSAKRSVTIEGTIAVVSVKIEYSGAINAIGLQEILPIGWKYANQMELNEGISNDLVLAPEIGAENLLEFTWLQVPDSPVVLQYRLDVAENNLDALVEGEILYRLDGPELRFSIQNITGVSNWELY